MDHMVMWWGFWLPPDVLFCGRNFMGSRWLENTVFRGHEISLVMYQEPLRNKLVPFHNSWMVNIIGGTIPCLFHKLLVLSWNKNGISILWWVNMIGNYWNIILVGGWALPLWKMMEFVSWDYEIPNWMESHNPNVPKHQPDIYHY